MTDNYISITDENGSVNISEDVLSSMVIAAVREVDGVVEIGQGVDLMGKLGFKSSKGVKINLEDERLVVDITVSVRAGAVITELAKKAQDAAAAALESMAGMADPQINVHVSEVVFDR